MHAFYTRNCTHSRVAGLRLEGNLTLFLVLVFITLAYLSWLRYLSAGYILEHTSNSYLSIILYWPIYFSQISLPLCFNLNSDCSVVLAYSQMSSETALKLHQIYNKRRKCSGGVQDK